MPAPQAALAAGPAGTLPGRRGRRGPAPWPAVSAGRPSLPEGVACAAPAGSSAAARSAAHTPESGGGARESLPQTGSRVGSAGLGHSGWTLCGRRLPPPTPARRGSTFPGHHHQRLQPSDTHLTGRWLGSATCASPNTPPASKGEPGLGKSEGAPSRVNMRLLPLATWRGAPTGKRLLPVMGRGNSTALITTKSVGSSLEYTCQRRGHRSHPRSRNAACPRAAEPRGHHYGAYTLPCRGACALQGAATLTTRERPSAANGTERPRQALGS